MFWVYILENPEGRFYIGQTHDLTLRMHSHDRTDKLLGKLTRKNGPWELVWSEAHPTRSSAVVRERAIKA
jgi:putative endonuclease